MKQGNDFGLTTPKDPEIGEKLRLERERRIMRRIMKLGPYELATLAARICPELCLQSPVEAIEKAKRLLIAVALEDFKSDANLMAAIEEKRAKRHFPYKEGIKIITGRDRPDRAEDYFGRFLVLKHGTKKAKAMLKAYEEKGFTGTGVAELQKGFAEWWPHKKGRQGRVKNPEKDDRTKPRPAAIPGMKSYLGGMPNEPD
jgi:hypothetical protein